MSLTILDALGPLIDALLMQYYFSTAHDEKIIPPPQKRLAFLFLLPMILLSARGLGIHTLLRFGIRLLCYLLYLLTAKGICSVYGLFLAVFTASCSTAAQNIFLSPLIDPGLRQLGLTERFPYILLLSSTLIRLAIFLLLHHFLPLRHIEPPAPSTWFILGLTVACITLTHSIRWMDDAISGPASVIFVLLQVFMLLFLVLLEREAHHARLEREALLQSAINAERLKTLRAQLRSDDSLRSLHHDMKNHLLALSSLLRDAPQSKAAEYLDELLQQTDPAMPIETGSAILDGLLSQKLSALRAFGAQFDVILDFRRIDFLSDMDLCTLFGNALDNAIEACRQVSDPQKRFVSIHSEQVSGQLILKFTNSYNGSIRLKNGLPVTSKSDSVRHGIGLSNIRRIAHKYHGVAEIDLSIPERFSLVLLLPLPTQPDAR